MGNWHEDVLIVDPKTGESRDSRDDNSPEACRQRLRSIKATKCDDSPTRNEHFPCIDATPEQLARALLRDPPCKREDWDYMKRRKTRSDR